MKRLVALVLPMLLPAVLNAQPPQGGQPLKKTYSGAKARTLFDEMKNHTWACRR
jgi:hypothetical protein